MIASRLLVEPRRVPWVRARPNAPYYALAAVCIGAFMGQLDASIVTVAMPTLQRSFHASVDAVTWVGLVYLLVLIAGVGAAGRLGDRYGRKLVYTYGFGAFVAGSALCALAPSLLGLNAFRGIQALGAAMLQANSVAIVYLALPSDRLGRGLGIQGAAQAVGLALGPSVGGALLSAGGWRLIFLVNIPAGILGILAAAALIPRSGRHAARTVPAAAPTIGSGAVAPVTPTGPPAPAVLRRGTNPLARRRSRWEAPVGAGLAASLLTYLLLFGTMFVVPFFLERSRGLSPGEAGLLLTALPVALGLTAPFAGRLAERGHVRLLTVGGPLLAGVALALAAIVRPGAGLLALLLAAAGAGVGAFTPANNATVMRAAPPERAGMASGVLNRTRATGTALGLAVTGWLFGTFSAHGLSPASTTRGFAAAAFVLAAAGGAAAWFARAQSPGAART